jgi:hypothetical protein
MGISVSGNIGAVKSRYDALRSLSAGSIIVSQYVAVGAVFSNPVRILKIQNLTNANLFISFDGITNHDIIPANAGEVYDICSNAALASGLLETPAGQRVYVMPESVAPTVGTAVYVTVQYASAV